MAGTPDGKLMTVAEAKFRLLELGLRKPKPTGFLGSPLFQTGVLLVGGALLGRLVGKKNTGDVARSPIRDFIMQAAAATAPFLVAQLLKFGTAVNPSTKSETGSSQPVTN